MRFIHYLKKSARFFDMFYSSDMLRYNHDPQHKTVTGGIITLFIVVMVIIGFGSMIRDTLNKTAITSSFDIRKTNNPSFYNLTANSGHMFMFGVTIISMDLKTTLNLAEGPRYFDINLRTVNVRNGQIAGVSFYDMVQCTDEHWSMLPTIVERSKVHGYSNWLCPKIGQTFPLQGGYTSPNQYITNIQILPCTNSSSSKRECASQAEIDLFFEKNPNNYFGVFFINPVINPSQLNYIDYYLQGNQYVIFSQKQGSQAWLYFTQYQITTDSSIWPVSQDSHDRGAIVEEKSITRTILKSQFTGYANFYFCRSYNTLLYKRSVQKLSSVFSYIGGLVGAVTAVLFLLRAYTATSLQLTIAFGLFQQSIRQGYAQKVTLLDKYAKTPFDDRYHFQNSGMNFIHYIKLKIYRFCKFFNYRLNWKRAEVLYNFQYQILHQLDVNTLIRRLIGLQTCMSYLFEKHQLQGIKNQRQINLLRARGLRQQLVAPDQLEVRHILQQQLSQEQNSQKKKTKESLLRKESLRKTQSVSLPSNNNLISHQNGFILRGDENSQKNTERPLMEIVEKANRNGESLYYLQNLWLQRDNNELSRRIWREVDQQIKELVMYTMDYQDSRVNHGSSIPSLDRAINKKKEVQLQQAEVV